MRTVYPTIVELKLYGSTENPYVTEMFMQYYCQRKQGMRFTRVPKATDA